MPSHEHRPGDCQVIASVRLRGDQPTRVRGVASVASPTGEAHLAVRIAGVPIYLEDRLAYEALRRAVRAAGTAADTIFPEPD